MREAAGRQSPLGIVINISNFLGVMLIWAIMLLMCLDVVSRNIFSQPIAGVSYVVASAVVAIVFLQLASGIRNDRLTRTEFIYLPLTTGFPAFGLVLKTVFNLAGCAVCAGIMYWTLPKLNAAWTRSEFVGIVGVMTFPRWPIIAVTTYGAGLAAVQFAANIFNDVRDLGSSRKGRGN